MVTPQANPEQQGAAGAPADAEAPPKTEAAPVRELNRLEQQAQELLDQEAEEIKARSEAEEEPPAEEPAAPEAWDAKGWERFAHKASSMAAHGKELPKLPDGIDVTTAPETMRAMLGALGYEAEGEKPEEEEAAPEAVRPFRPEALAPATLQSDPHYQLDVREAIEGAATREEQVKAIAEVNGRYATGFIDEAIKLLGLGHLGGEELDTTLAGMDDLVLPRDAADPAQALGFLMSAQMHNERILRAPRTPSEADIGKAREGWVKDLEAIAARQAAAASVEAGDLQSAANAGQVPGGERIPTLEEIEKMPMEQAVELERSGILDKALKK